MLPPLFRCTPLENGSLMISPVEGMQGPEQGLVGESRSGLETGPAEEAKPGERDVGEIVGASKLRRYVERKIEEAQMEMKIGHLKSSKVPYSVALGKSTALGDLRIWLADNSEKRSDLSHAQGMARRAADGKTEDGLSPSPSPSCSPLPESPKD